MEAYEQKFTIGAGEVQRFHLLLLWRTWWKGVLGFTLVGALVVALLYLPIMGPQLSTAAKAGITLLGAAATAVTVSLILVVQTLLRVKRQVRASGRGEYVQAVRIDGFGVHVDVGKDQAKVSFAQLYAVRETGHAFYLYLTANQAWILPKDQMADPAEDSRRLRTLFDTVIESKKLKLKK